MLLRDIIFAETDDFIIVNKPSSVSTHGGEKVTGEILTDFLIREYPELKTVGDAPYFRPGIVHRLDKDTSGVMIVARTQEAFLEFKKLFQEQKVHKTYLALSCGIIKKDFWEMKTLVGRSARRYTKQVSLPLNKDDESETLKSGKEAITEFEVLERLQNRYTLLHVYPKTGRMHQIRVQLASFGFPLVCDQLYGGKNQCCPKNLGRLFLHAESLKFNLFGKEYEFSAPLPDDLKNFLHRLQSHIA